MQKNNVKTKAIQSYPYISDKLVECLKRDFPDRLPRKYKDSFELGILVGQQQVIDKIVLEKDFNENE